MLHTAHRKKSRLKMPRAMHCGAACPVALGLARTHRARPCCRCGAVDTYAAQAAGSSTRGAMGPLFLRAVLFLLLHALPLSALFLGLPSLLRTLGQPADLTFRSVGAAWRRGTAMISCAPCKVCCATFVQLCHHSALTRCRVAAYLTALLPALWVDAVYRWVRRRCWPALCAAGCHWHCIYCRTAGCTPVQPHPSCNKSDPLHSHFAIYPTPQPQAAQPRAGGPAHREATDGYRRPCGSAARGGQPLFHPHPRAGLPGCCLGHSVVQPAGHTSAGGLRAGSWPAGAGVGHPRRLQGGFSGEGSGRAGGQCS